MKIIRHTSFVLALAISVTSGCAFRPYLRESRDPALSTTPPCYSGDVCPLTFDTVGFEWVADMMHSTR